MSLMMGKCVSEKKDWLSNYETSQTGFCRISLTINNDNNYNRLTFIAESRDGNDSTGEPWRTSPVMAIIGADSSDVSAAVASVLAINMMPLISYASVSQELSDKSSYPSFLR